ncbi:MAG: hypothetical protein K2L72_02510 [Clostridia bacterium]|nr:hypothetical protein [Clostridia bacterium]
MKVIFLDIDGVLNSRAYDKRRDWNKQTDVDETRLPLVKSIVDQTGAKIVLSSTWRDYWEKDPRLCRDDGVYLNQIFAKYGLEIFDKTPNMGLCAERRDEVKSWLDEAGEVVERFVVIDDYGFGWKELAEYFVKTNPNFGLGLEEEHVIKAVGILNDGE